MSAIGGELINPYQLKISKTFKASAGATENVPTMDKLGKCITSLAKLFEFPHTPDLPPLCEKFIGDIRVCSSVTGVLKTVSRFRKWTQIDAVGQHYWQTSPKIDVVHLGMQTISSFMSCAKYAYYLSAEKTPFGLSVASYATTCTAHALQVLRDHQALRKNTEKELELVAGKKEWDERKKKVTVQSKKDEYTKKISKLGKEILFLRGKLKKAVKSDEDLSSRRATAISFVRGIERAESERDKCQRYVEVLKSNDLEAYKQMKDHEWAGRIKKCQRERTDKLFSRVFSASVCAISALSLVGAFYSSLYITVARSVIGLISAGIATGWFFYKF